MSLFVLDMGSGNSCRNDKKIIERMLKDIAEVDEGVNDIVLKWQLFKSAPPNIPLEPEMFKYAYDMAERLCFETTSSIFDIESLRYLMTFKVPFVKIANRPDLYELAQYATVPVYVSTSVTGYHLADSKMMACISKYPATIEEYERTFTRTELDILSDHTVGWELYKKYMPSVIEKHFVHERHPDNPDAGLFAVTQSELAEVINA
jgi:sialic acid synthase SpsE